MCHDTYSTVTFPAHGTKWLFPFTLLSMVKSMAQFSGQHIPGYGGFCPTVKEAYGSTYGNATRGYYQSSRVESLSTSRKPSVRRTISEGGMSVTGISLAITTRPRSSTPHEHLSQPLPYTLNHTGPRRTEILTFSKSAQNHRAQYKDHTGVAPAVSSFTHRRHASAPPLTKSERIQQLSSGLQVASHHLALSFSRRAVPKRQSSARERVVRDLHFESR